MACLPYAVDHCKEAWGLLVFVIILCLICQVLFILLVKHHSTIPINRRSNVFSLRIAAIIPCFAILVTIGFAAPGMEPVITVIGAYMEGLAIWSFYKLCVLDSDGYNDIIKNFQAIGPYRSIPCTECYHEHPACCWTVIEINILAFLFLRPFWYIIAGFAEYYHHDELYTAMNILAIITLVIAMASLLRFYNGIGKIGQRLYIERKILGIKIIIFVVLVQNQILNGGLVRRDDSNEALAYNRRIFSVLVALECLLFSCFFRFFYSTFDVSEKEIDPTSGSAISLWCDVLNLGKYTFDTVPTGTASTTSPLITSPSSSSTSP